MATEYYEYSEINNKNVWINEKKSKELKLCDKPYTTTYLFMAVRTDIMQEYDFAKEYLMCNMMNYYIWPDDVDQNFIYFDFDINKYLNVKEVSFAELKEVNIINYIRENIDNNIYLNIHLDEFYIPCKELY